MEFRRCEINLKNNIDDFYNNSKGCILNSLKLEIRKKKLYNKIYSNLLRESKGKIINTETKIGADGRYLVKKLTPQELQSLQNNIGVKREQSETKQEYVQDETQKRIKVKNESLKQEYGGYNLETDTQFNTFG